MPRAARLREAEDVATALIGHAEPPVTYLTSLADISSGLEALFEYNDDTRSDLSSDDGEGGVSRKDLETVVVRLLEQIQEKHPNIQPPRTAFTQAIKSKSPACLGALQKFRNRPQWSLTEHLTGSDSDSSLG
mmetsp:Transcript_24376/g.47872  ORF Transcript_24376/g.47872 Transcript_24376/m.47872 type:complete len:132 (-) Transcript_24376:115-510(-)